MSPTQHRLGSTYRLQLNGFGFAAAADLVPWLHDLGVETLYLSPIAAATPGSTHGYDVIDPTVVDPELGGADGLESLLSTLAAHDMQALIDIVPNHVAATPGNPYFADLLRRGRESAYASWFDVDWEAADGRIVLPVLDASLRSAIDAGELREVRDPADGRLGVQLGETIYPLVDSDPDAGPDSGDLELLLDRQHYRLVDWRRANQLVNYRRFFAINELIGIRQEDPEVFAATHTLVAELANDERVAGFRVDHVDGMRDPGDYLERLRALVDATGSRHVIEVEKILARDEPLPEWPVDGTTGYDVAAVITGVLLDLDGVRSVAVEQMRASGDGRSFVERAVERKRDAQRLMFPGSVEAVTRHLAALGVAADFAALQAAVEALTANLDVYRTYRRDGEPMRLADVSRVRAATVAARVDLPPDAQDAVDKMLAVLAGTFGSSGDGQAAVRAWQQLTPAVVAKGVEDTALFDAGALLATCDVGVDPDAAVWSVDEWHDTMSRRQRSWPVSMTAGSTHDSKRSLDVRCRLATLSELGADWDTSVRALDEIVGASKIGPGARRYLYQTLVGVWPVAGAADGDISARVREHVVKAAREAAVDTTWNQSNEGYESEFEDLVTVLLTGPARPVIEGLVQRVAAAAAANSLSSLVLAATMPGVPDLYQGEDLWAFALTDPDNRRAVDWSAHRAALTADVDPADLLADWRSGRLKQHVVRRCLQLRRELGAWWDIADYEPVEVRGPAAEHVIAFARRDADRVVVTVAPRLPLTLAGAGAFPVGAAWTDTEVRLPANEVGWRDVLSGRETGAEPEWRRVEELLVHLPVSVLTDR